MLENTVEIVYYEVVKPISNVIIKIDCKKKMLKERL
jgi:hypothetical protein